MAKINVSKLIDTGKFLATAAGKELADLITYLADFVEQVIRTLNKGVTITDNLAAKTATVALKHNTEQVINTDNKIPIWIAPARVVSPIYGIDDFHWFVNSANEVVVRVGYSGSPSPSASITYDVVLVIFFS